MPRGCPDNQGGDRLRHAKLQQSFLPVRVGERRCDVKEFNVTKEKSLNSNSSCREIRTKRTTSSSRSLPSVELLRDLFPGAKSEICPDLAVLCLCEPVGVNVLVHVVFPSPNVDFTPMILSAAVLVGHMFDGTVIPMSESTIR